MSNTTTDASTLATRDKFWWMATPQATKLKSFSHFFFKEWKSTFAVRVRGRGFTHVSWFSACFQYTCVSACSIRIITHILCICAACMRWRRWWSSSKPFKCTFEVYSIPQYTFIYTEWEQPKFIEFNVRCSLVCERAFRTIVEFQCLLCARFSLCVNCFYDYLFVRLTFAAAASINRIHT